MKILMITNHSYMYWRIRRELTEALLADHEVLISTPFVGHEEDLASIGCRLVETEVDRRGVNPKTDGKLFSFYRKLLKNEKPDLVITYSVKPNIYAGLACRLEKIPYCVNIQGLGTAFQRRNLAVFVTALYKIALKNVKTVFFENEANAKLFRQRGILKLEQQTVLPGAGVNLERYAYAQYPKNDKVRFLYLGRIMREKGMDELFAAARKLRGNGAEFVLDLVGFYEDAYKEEVETLVYEGIALFHGFQSDPRPYYEAADCVILPSYHEGMSNVLLEASAMGRPLIASDIPGCREVIDAGRNGVLVLPKDGQSLYQAMQEMLCKPAAERAQMGIAGRAFMEAMFDKESVVEKTLANIFR